MSDERERERMDDLLEEALVTGEVPASATAEERGEIESLLGAARLLESTRDATEREAEASLPAARARFQRYVAETPAERTSWLYAISRAHVLPGGRLAPRGLTMAMAGSAAVVAVIALAAVLLWRTTLGDPESAYAQVVEPGDYVQVEGVIEKGTDQNVELTLASALGEVEVAAGGASLVGGDPERGVPGLKPGDRVLVSGVAGEGGRLTAQTVVLSDAPDEPPARVAARKELRLARARLEGIVVTYAISSEGDRGTVVIEAADGTRYRVPVDGDSATRLLEVASTALGQRVVVDRRGDLDVTFALELQDGAGVSDSPSLVSIRGVIVDALQAPSGPHSTGVTTVLTVETPRGSVVVSVPEHARSYVGRSGVEAGPRLLARAIGHTVSITGAGDPVGGSVTADAVVLGPKIERARGR